MADNTPARLDFFCASGVIQMLCNNDEDQQYDVDQVHVETESVQQQRQSQETSSLEDTLLDLEHDHCKNPSSDSGKEAKRIPSTLQSAVVHDKRDDVNICKEKQNGIKHSYADSLPEITTENSFHKADGLNCHENTVCSSPVEFDKVKIGNGGTPTTPLDNADEICLATMAERPMTRGHIPLSCPVIREGKTEEFLSDKEKAFLVFLDDMRCLTTKDDNIVSGNNEGVSETQFSNTDQEGLPTTSKVLMTVPSTSSAFRQKEGDGLLSDKEKSFLVLPDDMGCLATKGNEFIIEERPLEGIQNTHLRVTSIKASACGRMPFVRDEPHFNPLLYGQDYQETQRQRGSDKDIILPSDAKLALTSSSKLPEQVDKGAQSSMNPQKSFDNCNKQNEDDIKDYCVKLKESEVEMIHCDYDGTEVLSKITTPPVFKLGIQCDKQNAEPDFTIINAQTSSCGISDLSKETEQVTVPERESYLADEMTKDKNHTAVDFGKFITAANQVSLACHLHAAENQESAITVYNEGTKTVHNSIEPIGNAVQESQLTLVNEVSPVDVIKRGPSAILSRECQNLTENQLQSKIDHPSDQITVSQSNDSKIQSAQVLTDDNAIVKKVFGGYELPQEGPQLSEHSDLYCLAQGLVEPVGVSSSTEQSNVDSNGQDPELLYLAEQFSDDTTTKPLRETADLLVETFDDTDVEKLGKPVDQTRLTFDGNEMEKFGKPTLDHSDVLHCNQSGNEVTNHTPDSTYYNHKKLTENMVTVDLEGAAETTQKEICLKRKAEWGLQLPFEYTNNKQLSTNHARDTGHENEWGNLCLSPQGILVEHSTSREMFPVHTRNLQVQDVSALEDHVNQVDVVGVTASSLSEETPPSQKLYADESYQLLPVYKLVDQALSGSGCLLEQRDLDEDCLVPDNLTDVPELHLQHASIYNTEEKHLKGPKCLSPNFKWKYRPSCEEDEENVVPQIKDGSTLTNIQPLNIGLCNRSLRLGLSRRQKVKRLHNI